ncbi:MAG: PAC2 family protein [Nanoarchaeota archaeon]|nr:PAC2 family protein [Nanoarchaeota archaeon]
MKIQLNKRPKSPILIEGFPGFGLVGTIATEFLIEHLGTEMIGKIMFDDLPPIVAIHDNKVVEPLGIFYNKKFNVVILHAVSASNGFEWDLADMIIDLAKELQAKEVVSLEGVGSSEAQAESKAFYYSNHNIDPSKINVGPLKEGIIMGVTGALMLRSEKNPLTCFFADTHSSMPDSKAAAKIIEVLDKYLGLNVDYKPLLEQAQKFEAKLKDILSKSQVATDESEKKRMSYVG